MTLASSSLHIGPVSESSLSPTLGSMTPMPAQSLHLAGETENQKTKAGALREAEGRADSSCMEDVTSEVGLRDQERALGAQGEAAGRQGGKAVDGVAPGNGEQWAQPGHGKWAEDMTAEVEWARLGSALKSTSCAVLFCTGANGQPSGAGSNRPRAPEAPSQAPSGPCLDKPEGRELPEMHPGMGRPQLLIIPKNEAPAQPERDSPPSGLHPGQRSARPYPAGALISGCGNRSPGDGGDREVSSPPITVSAHQRSGPLLHPHLPERRLLRARHCAKHSNTYSLTSSLK